MCWTILGTLIVAACAGFAGRFGGAIGTMVMAGSYVWAAQSSRTTVDSQPLGTAIVATTMEATGTGML